MSKFLTIEINETIVRLAEVQQSGRSIKILKTYMFETPEDAVKDGKVRVTDTIVSAIRRGISLSEIKTKEVFFSVESTKILFKDIELPMMSKKDITNTLRLSFNDYFPVDETMYHISHIVKGTTEKDGQRKLLLDLYAVPDDITESYYNLSVALGLSIIGVCNSTNSILKLFSTHTSDRNVAIISINEMSSTLAISVGGNIKFNKTVPFGVYDAINTVRNSDLTPDDVSSVDSLEYLYTQYLLTRGITDGSSAQNSEEALRADVSKGFGKIAKAVEDNFTSFIQKEKIQIQEFILCGLGAGISGVSQLFSYQFGLPVLVYQSANALTFDKKVTDDPFLVSYYPAIATTISDVNFLTKEERAGGAIAKNKRIDRLFILFSVLIAGVCIAYGVMQWMNAQIDYSDTKTINTKLNNSIDQLRSLGVETAYLNYNAASSYYEQVQSLYAQSTTGNEDMTYFLKILENTIPLSARVSALSISPGSANVTFACDNKFVASGLLHRLRNMSGISSFSCNGVYMSDNESEEVTFQCSFGLINTAQRITPEDEGKETEATKETTKKEEETKESETKNVEDGTDVTEVPDTTEIPEESSTAAVDESSEAIEPTTEVETLETETSEAQTETKEAV